MSSLNFNPENQVSNRPYLSSNTLLATPATSSQYHLQCVPKEHKERVKSAPPRTRTIRDYQKCNIVKEEMRWEERCRKETTLQKNWEKNLGFLADYDQYGEQKQRNKPPKETPSVYSVTSRPLTASREYGSRVSTASANEMNRLQRNMSRGRKRNEDLLYYD
ncbi:uncharacterized protein C2orf50-like [Clytia hemisphaerica]|uniref:Uncharacterized protein n=1 Tax=Clytia hemisphaerica TaxID=252671 RepID=A0A7M5V2V9_9CNID